MKLNTFIISVRVNIKTIEWWYWLKIYSINDNSLNTASAILFLYNQLSLLLLTIIIVFFSGCLIAWHFTQWFSFIQELSLLLIFIPPGQRWPVCWLLSWSIFRFLCNQLTLLIDLWNLIHWASYTIVILVQLWAYEVKVGLSFVRFNDPVVGLIKNKISTIIFFQVIPNSCVNLLDQRIDVATDYIRPRHIQLVIRTDDKLRIFLSSCLQFGWFDYAIIIQLFLE